MVEVVAHYITSVLVASRFAKFKRALLLGLIGVLPDVDIFFSVHRWVTHSLIVLFILALPISLLVWHTSKRWLVFVVTCITIYAMHILLDLFNAPTPILWPLVTESYSLSINIKGVLAGNEVKFLPLVEINSMVTDFTPKPAIEGTLLSELGVILSILSALVLLIEGLARRGGFNFGGHEAEGSKKL